MKYVLFLSLLLNLWFQFESKILWYKANKFCESKNLKAEGFTHGYYCVESIDICPLYLPLEFEPDCAE